MNSFQFDFQSRLRSWANLRESLTNTDIENICIVTDQYWQQSPIMNHYLHPVDIDNWPDPWQLLDDNLYCPYARALGMIYTLVMLGISDIDLVEATDHNSIDVVLVLVDRAKYVLNYWPNTVVNNKLGDFTITKKYNIIPIIQKIGTL
jgi:hypothetical protein